MSLKLLKIRRAVRDLFKRLFAGIGKVKNDVAKDVSQARTLKRDLEKVGIPFCDEQGRYADFHSLRYSWATHLQRQGVNSRMAMELMRHSDRKLTDKIYTDVNLLPLGETVRNLSDEENLTHILTNISGKTCRNGSRVGEIEPLEKAAQAALNAASVQGLSLSDDLESLVEVAGVEPDPQAADKFLEPDEDEFPTNLA